MTISDIRTKASTVVGLAFLWLVLQASPYFPVSLALNSNTADVALISGCHTVYTVLFCLFAALVAARPTRTAARLAGLAPSGPVAGLLGSVGCGPLAAVSALHPSPLANVALGCGMVLVALFVVFAVVGWGRSCDGDFPQTAALVAGSFLLSSLLWLAWMAWGPSASFLLAACPVLSGVCLRLSTRRSAAIEKSGSTSSPCDARRPIPAGVLLPCVAIVYAAVLLVRVLTTMQAGLSAGSLNAGQQTVSAAVQVATAALLACTFAATRRQTPARGALMAFGVLVVVFLAALLQVVLTGNAQSSSFLGRRALVALEHCFELLTFAILAYNGAGQPARSARNLACCAVAVLAIPQFVSLDLFYRAGVMNLLVGVDLVVPIAAVASFLVAVLLVGLLTASASTPMQAPVAPAAAPDPDPSAWQEELCRQAVEGLDVSAREFEVLPLAYRGFTSANIARNLSVSESTVKTHLTHLYRKLGIHSRQDLIALVDSKRPQA